MKGRICLAGLLSLISSLSLAGSGPLEASTPVRVTSTSAPAVSARALPGSQNPNSTLPIG
jgi:hypothetical protein